MSTDAERVAVARRITHPLTIAFVSLTWVLALTLSWLGYVLAGPPQDLVAVGVLAVMGITGWRLRETDVGSRIQLSFISIILLAAGVIVGPVGAAFVGATATVFVRDRQPLVVRVFNVALFAGMGALGGVVYRLAGGISDFDEGASAARILIGVGAPLIVADIAQCLLNAFLIAGVMRASMGVPMRMQVIRLLSTSGLAYVGYGVIGFLFVVLWIPADVGWFSAVLVLAPLFVARWAFVQYGDEQRAHERTLRALVTAVETKEPHNAGHSERVAQLSEWIAEAMSLGHKEIQDIRTAGMLHDVGKVTVPARVLRSRQPHTDDDLVLVAEHAGAGVALVQDIEFLAGSLEGIAHHHERFDGLGYPGGLRGDAIPLAARIVAVADAYDSLTTERSYRPALDVAEAALFVRDRAGEQFDPAVCDALDKALVRHEWSVTTRTNDQLAAAGIALDHDEPEVSDRLAHRPDLRAQIHGAPARVSVSDRVST